MFLNNHGWSLKEMLFLSSIILLAMLVVVVLVNNLYSNLTTTTNQSGDTSKKYTYKDVEKNVQEAAKGYYKKTENSLITTEELIENKYLDTKKLTVENEICEGYVLVEENNFAAFITCPNYETEGY